MGCLAEILPGIASGLNENAFSLSEYRTWHDACSESGGREDGWVSMEQVSCELRWMEDGTWFLCSEWLSQSGIE